MASLNKVMLIGNLTRDAELRYLPSGAGVLEFRLAVSRKYKKQDGTEGEETCFVDVNLWGKRGEAVAKWLTKGKPLFVEGRLQLDEWEDKQSGEKRSKLRVVADNIEFLGGPRDPQQGGQGGGARAEGSGAEAGFEGSSGPRGGNGFGSAPRAGNGGPAAGNAGQGGYAGGNGGQGGFAGREPYSRPATAPALAPGATSTAQAMQVTEDDIPF